MPVAVKLICADPAAGEQMPTAMIGKALAEEAHVEYDFVPGTTHFLQVERPVECVRSTELFLDHNGFFG
jgi:hypothetical protein